MVFRFDRWLVIIPTFVIISLVPALSIFELLATGSIDLDAVSATGRGRRTWQNYAMGWAVFIPVYWIMMRPIIKYVFRGYIFEIDGEYLILDRVRIHHDQIQEIKETFLGVRVSTHGKSFYFHPRLGRGGFEAFEKYRVEYRLK